MKKYYYLVVNEDINSGLIQSQVIHPINSFGKDKVSIINIHKFYNMKSAYHINIPFAIPARLFIFNSLFFITPLLAMMYAFILYFKVEKNSTIIARGYFSTLVSYFLSKIKKIKFIFDSRSLFVDENVLSKKIKDGSVNYKMWKYFEKKFVLNAKKTIAVSLKQKEYYVSLCNSSIIELIPCYINNRVSYDIKSLNHIKESLGYIKEDIVVCYYGSLDDGWNNIYMYAKAFEKITNNGFNVLVISQNYSTLVKDERMNIKKVQFLNTTELTTLELAKYMQICDYGIVLMQKSNDWETRLSVKFVEYLNNGLQVIVGEYVGEAVRYATEKFSHRCIIYTDENQSINLIKKRIYHDNEILMDLFGVDNFRKILRD